MKGGGVKSLQCLWKQAADELAAWCDTCATRDYKTVTSRIESEGISFLTISLADFGRDFTKALDSGQVADDQFAGFKRRGGLPLFLGGFLQQVFDANSGTLLSDPSVDCIFAIRQLTLMFSKINLDCAPRRVRKAIDGYVECERELSEAVTEWNEDDLLTFSRLASLAFSSIFHRVNNRIKDGDLRGKHGPGSTADRIIGNDKYSDSKWSWRLEEVFPAAEHIVPSQRSYSLLNRVEFSEPGQELPVRVITVPKTLKTPRIIAMEPTCVQFMQQGILEVMMEEFKRDNLLYELIGFDDQAPNQRMAREGSLTGELATLDLKEASDRVSNLLVERLTCDFPYLSGAVQATRSVRADVPGHGVIPLTKFASMGSALCFPMEAFTFFVVVLMGIQEELNRPLVREDLFRLRGRVRIFGDDIILPKEYVAAVMSKLERFNFRVNVSKSFWGGSFRESCGGDYFRGHDVTVIKVKELIPTSLQNAGEVLSSVATRNRFYEAGMWRTCQWIDERLYRILRKKYPIVEPSSSLVGRISACFRPSGTSYDPELHYPLVKGYVAMSVPPAIPLDGEHALLKYFLKRGDEPLDREHLERSGRPDAVYLKLRSRRPW
jgi:hypothetical protein